MLLLAEKVPCIRCLVHCGVDDNDLPLVTAPRSPECAQAGMFEIALYTKGDRNFEEPLKCTRNWADKDVEWFVFKQYIVLSPFFDLDPTNVRFYPLTSRIVLPYLAYVETGQGGQASVGKVLIHPAHHNCITNGAITSTVRAMAGLNTNSTPIGHKKNLFRSKEASLS